MGYGPLPEGGFSVSIAPYEKVMIGPKRVKAIYKSIQAAEH
jgi:hypothetical protein